MTSLINAWRDLRFRRCLRRAMEAYASHLFGPVESKTVLKLLADYSFPLLKTRAIETVRVKIAILILSKGQWDLLQQELKTAQRDWRDVLYSAGMAFANWREVIRLKGVPLN